jgi:hypothetical protein
LTQGIKENPDTDSYSSIKKECEHGQIGELGRQKDDLPVLVMMDGRDQLNTLPPRPETPHFSTPHATPTETRPEAPTTPLLASPIQSDTRPIKPAPQPQPAPVEDPYIEAMRKLVEAGLVSGYCDERLGIFQALLEEERLFPVTKWYGARGEAVPENMLYSQYLVYNPHQHSEPQACVRTPGAGQLILIPWSQLSSI